MNRRLMLDDLPEHILKMSVKTDVEIIYEDAKRIADKVREEPQRDEAIHQEFVRLKAARKTA